MFVAWLMVQSLTVIHALCPYCMAAWAATFATVWYVTLANLGRIRHRSPTRLGRAVDVAGRNHSAILAGWLLIVAVLVTVTAWGSDPMATISRTAADRPLSWRLCSTAGGVARGTSRRADRRCVCTARGSTR